MARRAIKPKDKKRVPGKKERQEAQAKQEAKTE